MDLSTPKKSRISPVGESLEGNMYLGINGIEGEKRPKRRRWDTGDAEQPCGEIWGGKATLISKEGSKGG